MNDGEEYKIERRRPACGIGNCPAENLTEKIERLIEIQANHAVLIEEIRLMKAGIGLAGKVLIAIGSAGPAMVWCYSYFKEHWK